MYFVESSDSLGFGLSGTRNQNLFLTKLFSLNLMVPLLLMFNLFLFLLKTSSTVENADFTIHVVGKAMMLDSTC